MVTKNTLIVGFLWYILIHKMHSLVTERPQKINLNTKLKTFWTCYKCSGTETALCRMGLDHTHHSDNTVNCMKVKKMQHAEVYFTLKLSTKFNDLFSSS
jgi:hypothetical protein